MIARLTSMQTTTVPQRQHGLWSGTHHAASQVVRNTQIWVQCIDMHPHLSQPEAATS